MEDQKLEELRGHMIQCTEALLMAMAIMVDNVTMGVSFQPYTAEAIRQLAKQLPSP